MPAASPSPGFIDGCAGRLFSVYYPPAIAGSDVGDAILLLPPFAEEMNRSRPMTVRLARTLAGQGIGCLILDLFATGDSAGDFAQARWSIWRQDAIAGLKSLAARGHPRLAVLGLRLGAVLALDIAGEAAAPRLSRVVLWQPVARGDAFLNQFLRIRLAAGLADGAGHGNGNGKETSAALRRRLADGETLEIAGYELSSALAAEIAGLRTAELRPRSTVPIDWFEVAAEAESALSPAAETVVSRLSEAGIDVSATVVAGEPFWAIEEPVLCPSLLAATCRLWPTQVP